MKGKLKHWNEEKGFGFIGLEHQSKDIFIHISSLKKMSRRPLNGDIIIFEIHIDSNGKKRAVNCQIQGVAKKTQHKNRYKKQENNHKSLLYFVIFLIITVFIYMNYAKNLNFNSSSLQIPLSLNSSVVDLKEKIDSISTNSYTCERGKIYCSQMSSCREAKFYLRNCPGTRMDGNHDGVPCESQWCR